MLRQSQRGAERIEDSLAACRDRLDYGNAEGGGERPGIDEDALAHRLIHHVEADDHGRLEVLQFERKFHAPRQLRSVDDVDDHIPLAAQKALEGNGFNGIGGCEGIEARQVNQVNDRAVDPRLAVSVLDGSAGKV